MLQFYCKVDLFFNSLRICELKDTGIGTQTEKNVFQYWLERKKITLFYKLKGIFKVNKYTVKYASLLQAVNFFLLLMLIRLE